MNNTLVKGLQLLELLARSERPLGVSDLAAKLALGKSNVHRLLQALVELGYVQKNEPRGTYQASLKLWEVGTALASRMSVKTSALAAMERLLTRTRETVHLSVLDGDEVVYLHKLDSPEPVRAYSEIGGRAPAHCVATGKAILAWQSEQYLSVLVGRLQRHTPKTITDPHDFLRDLERVRSNGYAVNRGEWRETVWGIGSPITNSEGVVVAAIGVSGPSSRIKPAHIKELASEVMAAAATVSANVK
ncbi:MAG: IclR family transcriptional regulator, partial [Burkholderiaceae bacterium]